MYDGLTLDFHEVVKCDPPKFMFGLMGILIELSLESLTTEIQLSSRSISSLKHGGAVPTLPYSNFHFDPKIFVSTLFA